MTRRVSHPLGVIEVTRKRIRHLYLRLAEEPAVIRVSAPHRFDDAQIRAFVTSREAWIRRQRDKAARRPPRFDGDRLPEQLHLLGRPYHLVHGLTTTRRALVRVEDEAGCIHLAGDGPATAREALRRHCRAHLTDILAERVPHWAERMALPVPEWRIRRMKTRWGSCNIRERRIWLNLELVRMPVAVIDLVVVHELAHLIERGHNARFYAVMDDTFPAWRQWESTLADYGIVGL
ncbi:MAG: M48 family metallopeptidase [Pseudomonadota bacterium]